MGGSPEDEKTLVTACLEGRPGAWERLTARCAPAIAAKAAGVYRRRTGRPVSQAEIDDVSQEVFLQLSRDGAKALRDFRWECSLITYILAIATRCIYARLARERGPALAPRRRLDLDAVAEEAPSRQAGPKEAALTREEADRVRQIVETLPPRDRLALKMYFWGGASPSRIAPVLGTTPTYVCVVIRRAIEKIKKNMEDR